jgi:hypothetical protein
MANARIAASSLMDTVTNTANMLSSTVNVAADSINMLGGYVSKHRIMQQKRTLIELDNFDNQLLTETTLANAKRKQEIDAYLANNQNYTQFFNEEYQRLSNLLNPQPNAEPTSA